MMNARGGYLGLVLVILRMILGVSGQTFLEITQNHTFPFTCPGTAVTYTCKSSSPVVQWIVESLNVSENVINNPVDILQPRDVAEGVILELVAVQPIITTLTIVSRGSFNMAGVVCTSGILMDSMLFDSGQDPPGSPGIPNASGLPADFEEGTFRIEFERSMDDVEHYVANCSANADEQVVIAKEQLSAIMRVPAGISKRCYSVEVRAVNFCGTPSQMVTTNICIKSIEGYIAVVFLYPFTVVILIAVGLVLFIVYHYKWKRGVAEQSDHEEIQLETKHK